MARDKTFIIAIDGVDYSGKSTLARLLTEALNSNAYIGSVQHLPFPSTNHYGKLARANIAVNDRTPVVLKKTAGYLVSDFISTPLNTLYKAPTDEVTALVYDRYVVSCLASQGDHAYNVVMTGVDEMEETKPDVYVLLTVDYETALKRSGKEEKWDAALEDSFMHSKEAYDAWQERYVNLHAAACRRMHITQPLTVDTSNGTDTVFKLLMSLIEPVIDAKFYKVSAQADVCEA